MGRFADFLTVPFLLQILTILSGAFAAALVVWRLGVAFWQTGFGLLAGFLRRRGFLYFYSLAETTRPPTRLSRTLTRVHEYLQPRLELLGLTRWSLVASALVFAFLVGLAAATFFFVSAKVGTVAGVLAAITVFLVPDTILDYALQRPRVQMEAVLATAANQMAWELSRPSDPVAALREVGLHVQGPVADVLRGMARRLESRGGYRGTAQAAEQEAAQFAKVLKTFHAEVFSMALAFAWADPEHAAAMFRDLSADIASEQKERVSLLARLSGSRFLSGLLIIGPALGFGLMVTRMPQAKNYLGTPEAGQTITLWLAGVLLSLLIQRFVGGV